MNENEGKNIQGFCNEHSVMCYKLEEIQKLLTDISKKVENSVTREELTSIVKRLEKDIEELRNADHDHSRDISMIREALVGIQKVLEASQKSQDELRADYKQLFDIINKIYTLLQANLQNTVEQGLEKVENKIDSMQNTDKKDGSKVSSSWGVLGIFINKYGKYLVPILWIAAAIVIFTFYENRVEILKALGLLKVK